MLIGGGFSFAEARKLAFRLPETAETCRSRNDGQAGGQKRH